MHLFVPSLLPLAATGRDKHTRLIFDPEQHRRHSQAQSVAGTMGQKPSVPASAGPVPRQVPPITEWPLPAGTESLLLELAPHNPAHQLVHGGSTSGVVISQVKEGHYSTVKATFVLLDVILADAEIPVFGFDVIFTSTESLDQQADARQQPANNESKQVSVMQRVRQRSSRIAASIARRSTQVWRSINTQQRAQPTLQGPVVMCYGPAEVLGRPTTVNVQKKRRTRVEPKVKFNGVGVEGVGMESGTRLDFTTENCPYIRLAKISSGVRVRAAGAKIVSGGCPTRFRVAFVVAHPGPVDIQVIRDETCFSDFLHWASAPVKRTLRDTTRGGTIATAATCVYGEACEERPDCRQLHPYHMTPGVWKERLILPLRGFDDPSNDEHWVTYCFE